MGGWVEWMDSGNDKCRMTIANPHRAFVAVDLLMQEDQTKLLPKSRNQLSIEHIWIVICKRCKRNAVLKESRSHTV